MCTTIVSLLNVFSVKITLTEALHLYFRLYQNITISKSAKMLGNILNKKRKNGPSWPRTHYFRR